MHFEPEGAQFLLTTAATKGRYIDARFRHLVGKVGGFVDGGVVDAVVAEC
jgi:hypothetical protein